MEIPVRTSGSREPRLQKQGNRKQVQAGRIWRMTFILRAPTKRSSGPRKPRKVQDKTETTSEITVLDWATQKTKQIQVPSSEVSSVVSWALAAPSNSRRVGERFCWAITLWTQETRIFTPSKILPCIFAPYKPAQKDMSAQANSRTSVGCFNIFWSKQASFRRF